jgi:uncharacterized membrane protein/IMP cyclohydrolase
VEVATRARVDAADRADAGRRLFVGSAVMLFTELALIRWLAAHVVYLAYFTNFVLLASFLGIGIGFLRADRARDRSAHAPWALAALVGFVALFPVRVSWDAERELVGFAGLPPLPMGVELAVLFVGTAVVMALVAEAVARAFARLQPLEAYRLDIAGSLVGIGLFSLASFAGTGPVVWFAAIAIGLAWALRPLDRRGLLALAGAVAIVAAGSLGSGDRWSPYYRVSTREAGDGRVAIRVNGRPHQTIVPVTALRADDRFYLDPYARLARPPGEVLIVGAGNGNDVAVALSEGATRVDAVEIDPLILRIGRERHPDAPYDDPRVRAIVDDGRAFLQRTDRRYDLILFALPDSLTLLGGQGSLRLESYLFTVEALREVRAHLREGGAFSMYNYYRDDVFERFAATMREAFGHAPCIDRYPIETEDGTSRSQAVLTIGLEPDDVRCAAPGGAERIADAAGPGVLLATDDRPFPYLGSRSIPTMYAVSLALVLLVSAAAVRALGGPLRSLRPSADLFCMGVAFLLLETTNVVRFALLFGTTWLVNALVFAGILLAVLGAVEVARRARLPRPTALYAALGIAIAVAWAVPTASLLELPVAARYAAGIALAFTPVFLANLIFAQRFREVASSTMAFAANLLGAMVGGVLEYASLVTGYRALLVFVAAAYAAALLLRPRATVAT